MTLVELPRIDPAWADLVANASEATAFHHPAWSRVLSDAYGFSTVALAEPGLAAGVLLARVPRLRGRAWVSLPFSDHCPPLARDAASLQRLADGLGDWAAREGAAVEVRGSLPSGAWTETPIGVRYVLSLSDDLEGLRMGLSETHRRWLRQGERAGLEVRFGRSAEDLADFYRLHVATRRRQGVPVQPRQFFDAVRRNLLSPGHGVVALVSPRGGTPVAAAVVFAWNGTAIGKYQASDPGSWNLRPNHLLYWAVIRWAREAGCARFDFGRTEARHAGLQQWKAGWGAEAIPLSYAHIGAGAATGDRGALSAALGHVIRRSPAIVCRSLGALLYRYAA
ncbi:MAG TPA: GNAT family N-acetyltransferase [Terriglobales bacterium]|nr:GNAT family N-acetyltransferase [Terriglobales bacterium]